MLTLGEMLQASLWSRSLSPEQLRRVESEIITRQIPAGGFVCRKGEPVEHWIGVIDGLVKMTNLSADGKPTTFTGLPTGGWVIGLLIHTAVVWLRPTGDGLKARMLDAERARLSGR